MLNIFRSPEELAFRDEVRAFLHDSLPLDLAMRNGQGFDTSREDALAWQQILYARGWGAPHWPIEDGGCDWTPAQRMIFDEECAAACAPTVNTQGIHLLGPVLAEFGTPEQKARFLPPILRGEVIWCQGFSEPDSGSDLASLRCQAVRDGDHYIVNGQKIWTSHAQFADWIFLIVRTDSSGRKQQGISFLLADMRTPGITVRPLISLDDQHHLNETFYVDVRVPAENVVGAEGDGWNIAKFMLGNERGFTTTDIPGLKRILTRIREAAAVRAGIGGASIDDPIFAARLASLEAQVMSLEMAVLRAVSTGGTSASGWVIGSVLKVRASETLQALTSLLLETIGPYGSVLYPQSGEQLPGPAHAPGIAAQYFHRRAATIYGGSNEVQRNIIAKARFAANGVAI